MTVPLCLGHGLGLLTKPCQLLRVSVLRVKCCCLIAIEMEVG